MSIQAHNLTLARGSKIVLSDFSMTLDPGDLTAVLGANGAGKSSLISALAGELLPQAGSMIVAGVSIDTLGARAQARLRAVLPQQPSLDFALSVSDVLQMGAYPFEKAKPDDVTRWVARATTLLSLESLMAKSYMALSGGEQQRVQLARTFVQCFAIEAAQGFAYLLLDEPLSSLDPKHQILCMRALADLSATGRVGVLVVLHDLNMAAQFCSKLILLAQGQVIAQGKPPEVLVPELLQRAYDLPMSVLPHPFDAGRLLVLHEVKGLAPRDRTGLKDHKNVSVIATEII